MDADYSWRESVARIVLLIVETSRQAEFTIEQVYEFEGLLQNQFPGNHHVREKMRQSLQKLVADGLLLRTQRGVYRVNTASPELVVTTDAVLTETVSVPVENKQFPAGNEQVKQRQRIIMVRLRNTILAIELKKAYHYKCQVCQYALPLIPPNYYAEGHHLRPLGNGHHGPDVAGNILVLCPNHHTMFDAGAAAIEPESNFIVHRRPDEFPFGQKLIVADWHRLEQAYIAYHYNNVFTRPQDR